MKTIPAGEFKANCLQLMDLVNKSRGEITITKHGKPVAKLVPITEDAERPVYGYLKELATISGDIVAPVGESWDADS